MGDEPSRIYHAEFVEAQAPVEDRPTHVRLDPLFAATLINHVVADTSARQGDYKRQRRIRAGITFDLKV